VISLEAIERRLERLEQARAALRTIRLDVPTDPVNFARLAGIEPEAWQRQVLRSQAKAKILLCGRRTGKSTVAAVMALHKALTTPGFDVIFVAPSLDQAQIPYLMAISMYRYLERPVPAISERRTGLELSNGSELRAMAAVDRTKRGFSADLLVVDEASRIEEPAYYGGLLPSITRSQGYVMLMSTPWLNEGFFAETWHSADDEWERTFLTSEESEFFQKHPDRLAMVKSKVPDWYYRQEYLCEFLEDEFSIFRAEDVDRAARRGEDLDVITFEEDTW
jgi:phage terminase large subunit-like protein